METKVAYEWAKEIAHAAQEAARRSGASVASEARIRLRNVPVQLRMATYQLLSARGIFDKGE